MLCGVGGDATMRSLAAAASAVLAVALMRAALLLYGFGDARWPVDLACAVVGAGVVACAVDLALVRMARA